MLKEWMNTPWAQEAHQASLNSLIEAARSGEQVHPAFASMAVELDEIDRVLLDQLREQRIAVLDCCLSRMTRDKTFAGRKEAEHGTEIPLVRTSLPPQRRKSAQQRAPHPDSRHDTAETESGSCHGSADRLHAGEIALTALGSRFLRVCKW